MKIFTTAALLAALAIALFPANADAKGMSRGDRQKSAAQSPEDQAKRKAAEQAYQDGLRKISAPAEKPDPWKTFAKFA